MTEELAGVIPNILGAVVYHHFGMACNKNCGWNYKESFETSKSR